MDWAIVRLLFKWLLEQPDGKQTDKLGDLYFLEESYEIFFKGMNGRLSNNVCIFAC